MTATFKITVTVTIKVTMTVIMTVTMTVKMTAIMTVTMTMTMMVTMNSEATLAKYALWFTPFEEKGTIIRSVSKAGCHNSGVGAYDLTTTTGH